MSSKLTKLFIDFASDIVTLNTSLDVKTLLLNRDTTQKFDDFIKDNKIKQKKEKKDPNSDEPTKPKTAYIIFCSSERNEIIKSNPTAAHKDVTSLLGQRWKDIKANDKDLYNKYVDIAAKEKSEYEDQMIEYRIHHNIPEKITKVKKIAIVKPEKPMSPFYYYLKDTENDVKLNNPTLTNKQICQIIKKKWNELKDDKDDIVIKYKNISKDKKIELNTMVSISTQTSPFRPNISPAARSPARSPIALSPAARSPRSPRSHDLLSHDISHDLSHDLLSHDLSPTRSLFINEKDEESPTNNKKKDNNEAPKKKKKKNIDGVVIKKKKLIKKITKKDDDEDDAMNFDE